MSYEEKFQSLIDMISSNKGYDIKLIQKAYEFAKNLHSGQYRKGGDEYIVHPVDVAYIIAEMGLDTNLICAALLHDTVEDCGYTLEKMKKDFNPLIAQIVDAVTEIKLGSEEKNAFMFPREEEEIQTYQKLISMGKTNKFAFYIKFADRLNNLRTIECFKRYKKVEKVKQTERWILPIIKLLKATAFYFLISDECYKIIEEEEYKNFQMIFNKFNNQNEYSFDLRIKSFIENISNLALKKRTIFFDKIITQNLTPFEISLLLPNEIKMSDFTFSKMNYFTKMPVKKIFILFKDNSNKADVVNFFFELFNNKEVKKIFELIGYNKEEVFGNNYFILEDDFKTKYECYLFTQKEYIEFINGSSDGAELNAIDEAENNNLSSKFIKVFTRSEEQIILPENSTVLDFAFKLHKDLGFSCKFAHINDSPNIAPIYTRLSNGDKVNLTCERDENGESVNIAKLRWLTYCRTEYSQRILTKYFEGLYE